MTPRLTTRAELEAWVLQRARQAVTPQDQLKAIKDIRRVVAEHMNLMEGRMAAQLRDEGQNASVKLVRPRDFGRLVENCKNPPKPSAALISMFATRNVK